MAAVWQILTMRAGRMVERGSQRAVVSPDMSDILDGINKKARDNARTPMQVCHCLPHQPIHLPLLKLPYQWDSTPHAGFTTAAQPWMRVNDDYPTWNAVTQVGNKDSVHAFWKSIIALRKSQLVLVRLPLPSVTRCGDWERPPCTDFDGTLTRHMGTL